ncbi:MAG: folate-binding protein [Pseudomonadota bacterium]|nr:folate-binding protein [Pseudomonadota bacterium]
MSDKPIEAKTRPIALPEHRVLTITGPDALKFSQAQFMNDVSALADGDWQWSGWLSAKGRLIALFALLRLDAETLWLLLPDYPPAGLAEALEKYVFRSKLKIELIEGLQVAGDFDAAAAADKRLTGDAAHGIRLDGWPGGRHLLIGEKTDAATDDETARWREADLRAGLPRLDASQVERWTPQQLSLEHLAAYSVKKGCYPGQEIVARTHFLGQAKRGLRLLQLDQTAQPGAAIQRDGRSIGEVVAVAATLALAVLPLDGVEGGLRINDRAASVLT